MSAIEAIAVLCLIWWVGGAEVLRRLESAAGASPRLCPARPNSPGRASETTTTERMITMAVCGHDPDRYELLCPSELTSSFATHRVRVWHMDLATRSCCERRYVRTRKKNARPPGSEGGFLLGFPHFEAETTVRKQPEMVEKRPDSAANRRHRRNRRTSRLTPSPCTSPPARARFQGA